MMRIAQMTWFRYENYGSVLQAGALNHVLTNHSAVVDLIDYKPHVFHVTPSKMTAPIAISKAWSMVKRSRFDPYRSKKRTQLFTSFINDYLSATDSFISSFELREVLTKYDAIICGSDQIWSPNCFDSNYFLPFVEERNKKIAYAPSFGVSKIVHPEIRRRMAEYISAFGSISSREVQGACIIKELTGKTSPIVLDPTLLLDREQWIKYFFFDLAKCDSGKDNYILCYFLGDYKRYFNSVAQLAKDLDLPVITIPVWFGQDTDATIGEVGPKQFVELFMGASYVCTDSFHGVAFSTNFNKPFTVFKRFSDADQKSQNSRIVSFLSLMSLEKRLASPKDRLRFKKCDFNDANRALQELRRISLAFIAESLDKAASVQVPCHKGHRVTIAEHCCGCGACASTCPRSAITIGLDADGFQRYRIDDKACIGCGACKSVCPLLNITASSLRSNGHLHSYKSKVLQTLHESSSGAFGADAAALQLKRGYRVFGCAYEKATDSARHIEVDTDSLCRLKGSKYIQSRSAEALDAASKEDGPIAFFGTPCQAAGLDALLRKKGRRSRAIIIDLICQGVPSANLWSRYLKDRIIKNGIAPHPDVCFRSMIHGWSPMYLMMLKSNLDKYSGLKSKDDFYAFFSRGLCNAKSCYECPFRERSAADIRIGDYWGPRYADDKQGVSMVVTMTDRGETLVDDLASLGARVERQSIEEYWTSQSPYNQGLPLEWYDIIADLAIGKNDLSSLRKKYCAAWDQRARIGKVKYLAKKVLHRV